MGEWSQKISADIEQKLSGTKDSDLRFLRVAEYLRMVKRVDDFSRDCDQCQQFQEEIELQVNTISNAVNNTGKDRRNYDRHIDRLARHMKKEHGFYPPFFYRYSLSFFYTLIGGVLGLLTSFFFSSIDRWFFIIPPLVVGLLVGQFVGGQKDAKIRANQKIL